MKRLFLNFGILILCTLPGLSLSLAQGSGCPSPTDSVPPITPQVCINAIPGTYDLTNEGTGADPGNGTAGWQFFSGIDGVTGNPVNLITTTQVLPNTYYAAYVDNSGALCYGNRATAVMEVVSKPAPPFQSMTVCASATSATYNAGGLASSAPFGSYDLSQIPNIDQWYVDPAATTIVGNLQAVGPRNPAFSGLYYGSQDANNTGNGCESELAVLLVEPAPLPPQLTANNPAPPFCEDPVTGTFNLNDLELQTNPTEPNYLPLGGVNPIPASNVTWYSDAGLTTIVAGPVPAGDYYAVHNVFPCLSQPLQIIIEPREAAPTLAPTGPVCADDNNGTNPGQFDLATVAGSNPGGGVTLIWYADLADISASPLATLVVDPGTYYATYQGVNCESAPTAFVVNATPEQLTAYNCDGVAGNNAGGGGNCVEAGQPHIRLFSCTDAPFTTADVDAEVKLNDEYGEYIVGGSFGNAVLTYYDDFADANNGSGAVALQTILDRFDNAATNNNPRTENVWVTQTDPNTGCESAPTALRLRMRARPEPVATDPDPICIGSSSVDFWGQTNLDPQPQDNRNVAESWNLYNADPSDPQNNAVLLSSSPADANGEPDGSVSYTPVFPTAGTFTFWYEAVNEGNFVSSTCNEFISVTITVQEKPEVQANARPSATECSGTPLEISWSNAGPVTAPPVSSIDVSVVVDGGLIVDAPAATGNISSSPFNAGTYANLNSTPLNVTFTIIPRGNPLPSAANGCEGDPVTLTFTINPEPVMTVGLEETICSNQTSDLDLTLSNGLTGETYYWNQPAFSETPANGFDTYPTPGDDYSRLPAPGNGDNIQDSYLNQTLGQQTATYTITPVSALGCEGENEDVVIRVNPEPVITQPLGDTICSGGTTNIALSVNLPDNITAVAYDWDAPVLSDPANMTGGSSSGGFITVPVPLPGQIFIQDQFTNTSTGTQTATYKLRAQGDAATGGCVSINYPVVVTIYPEPIFQTNFPQLLCSNDPTVDLNAAAPTITNNIVANAVAWFEDLNRNPNNRLLVPLTGVSIVDNGDVLIYEFTTIDGCTYFHEETVTLEEAPVLSAVANPVVCADDQSGAAIIDLAAITPTATQSGNPALGNGAWYTRATAAGLPIANPAAVVALNGDQFTYEFAAANSCSASVTITVTVNPLPTAILTGGGTICPPTNTAPAVQVTLTGVGPWEVTWTDGTTTTTQSGIIPYPLNPTGSVVTNPWTIPGSATTAGTYQVTSTTDANGCSTPANYPGSNTVVVAPDGPPAAICDDITVQLDGNGFATITGGDVGSKSTDGCTGNGGGNLTLTVSPFLFTCSDLGVNQVTLTATDPDNNSSNCVANVTVEDNIRPTITCANNVICDASSNPNACYWEVPDTQLDPLSTSDNCGVASVTHDFGTAPSASTLQGAQFPKGTTTVVWTVADSSGNTRTCAINVTVNDNTTPTIVTCPPDRNVFTSIDEGYNCESFVPNMLNDLVWEDNCPSCVTTSQSPAPWSLVIGGHNSQTIVTFTVTDDNQSTTCTATLTLIDDEDPTFTSCPGPVNVECSDLARTPADLGEPTVADNCAANPTWTHSDVVDLSGCNNTGTITRTFTADDGNGNTNSSCVQVITVEDTEVPVITGFNDPTEYCSFTDIPRYDYNAFVAAARGFNKPDPDDNCGLDISSFTFLSLNVIGNCNANPNGPEVVETYQIADNCGNIDTAIVTFIINDTQGPIWDNNPPIADVTVNCEDNNSSVALGTPAFSDNCSATLTESQTSTQRNDPADCSFYNYTISRTFTVTDICGNSISHTQTITVQDTTAPVITCFSNLPPSQVVDTDAGECFATIGSGRLFVRAIENCPATDLTYTYDVTELSTGTITSYSGSDAAGQYGKGDWKIEFFVTDPCGNSDMCVQTFTVEDNEAPMISCVGTLEVVLGSDGTATIDSSDIVTAINDNCPGATVALDKSSFDCSEVTAVTGNTITVTATVTDHSGNTADCSTIVTVKDNLPPTPDCQDITVYLDATCNASITAAEVAGTPSDNCQAIVVGASPLTFDGSDLTILSGNNPNPPVSVTVDYTDPSGNDASCTALVRVKDTIPPSITCLDPAPVNNELDKCEAFVNVPVPSLGDNCQVTTLTNDYTNLPSASATYPVGTTVVTWRVFDFAGNYTECAVDVNVIDAQAPEAICQDITVQLDANGQASITPADLDNNSSDNCPDFTLSLDRSTFDCSDIQGAGNTNNVVAVTLTITDVAKPAALDVAESDQATCNVTVRDEVLPIALCQNTTVQLDANGAGTLTAAQVDNGSNDACGIAPGFPTISKTAFDCSDVGTQSITLTVEDVNGNSNIVSCDVTIKDKVAPVAVCQDTIVQLDHSGNGILTTAMVDDGSSDACGIASLVVAPSAFTCADLGTNQVTLTVTDVNGNVSTCTSNVEVRDAVSPTAKCLDLTIQLDANGAASITVADIDKGTDDNCDQNPTITISKSSFGCADVGTNQVTLRAVDNFGNDATCISTITVEDNIDPTALCAADFSVQLSNVPGNGTASITVADIDNGSSDACGLASTTIDKSSFDCSDLGANVITLTVVDVNANISTCTTTVTVEDVSDPVITAAGFTQCNDPGTCDAAVSIVATATDNCSIMNSGWSAVVTPAPVYGLNTYQINGQQGLDASGTYPVGTVRVLFNVVDQSGNFDTLSVTVIIEDCDAPVITQAEGLCDSTITLPNVTGDCYQQYAWTHPTASDNCLNPQPIVRTISNPSVQPSNLPGSSMALFPVGTTTITYTATDGFNNVTTCTFDVEVVDTEDPVILNCPTSPISLNSDPGSCSKQFVLPNNIIANDNCPIVALTDDVPAGSIFEVGTTTVTFTATDNSGRTADCVFDVIVNDTEAPILTCSPDIVVDNDPGVCGAVVNYPIPQYTDGCIGFKNMLDPSMLTIAANIRGLGDGTIDTGSVPHFITMTSSDNATPSSGGADTSRLTFVAPNANNLSFTFTYETPDERAFFDMFGYEVNGVFTQLVDDNDLMATGEVNIPLNAGDVFSWEIRSFDGFGGRATVVISQPAFGYLLTQLSGLGSGATFPVGTTTEQWMVEDPAGNKDTCSFTVTVNDTEAPAILANSTTTVTENGTGGSLGNSMINSRGTYRFTLNVGNGLQVEDLSLSLRGTHGFVGDLDILLTSPSGTTAHLWDNNLDNGTDDFDVTFDDNSGQQLTHTNANGPLGRGLSWRTNADGEDEFGMLVGNPTNLGAFTGESANGTWTLTIIDNAFGDFGTLDQWSLNFINAIPNTVPAADITLPNDPGQCGATVNYGNLTVSDNCPGATLTQTSGSGSGAFYPIGTSTETFVATDAAGNTAELSFVITVEDQEAPSINCPPSSTVGNDPGDCDATIQYTIGFNDNCSATLTQTSGVGNGGSVPVGGSSTETYVVTDASGNTAGCSFTLTVEDREAPQVSGCPGNITVDNDPGLCAAVVSWNTNNLTTSDNCPGETLASNFQSGDAFPVGTTTVIYTVTDAAGLTAACSFDVTVNDTEGPVITCPADITVTQDVSLSPTCGANVTSFIASATDNCSATITNGYHAGGANASGFFSLGTTTVTFTATDPAGNTDACSATVTVNPAPATASVTNGTMNICSDDPNILATGNNPGQGFSGQWTVSPATGVVIGSPSASASSITFPAAGTYTVSWTVTNDCDPATSASASFTVNVFDKPGLAISGTGPTVVGGTDGTATVVASGGSGSFGYSWDNGGTTATITGLTQGTYTVTVTDLISGCVETASITLNDPALIRVCYVRNNDPSGFSLNLRPLIGSIPGNGTYIWNGLGTYHLYANGEVHIFGSILDRTDNTKEWYVDIWLEGREFWGPWAGAGNGWAGNPATVGTDYISWTYFTLNGTKSIMIGQQSFLGSNVSLTNRSYTANSGPGGWQEGSSANNFDSDYGLYGQFNYTGSFAGYGELSIDFTGCFGTFRLRPVAILEGAFDGSSGLMRDDLNASSLVPTTEPYTGMGYTHVGGGNETVAQSVLNTTGPDAIVDWVILELRDENAPTTVVASRSALLQADGDIVDVDGNSAVAFEDIQDGNYYVTILHRNHAGIMTAHALPVVSGANPTSFDFTTAPIYGGSSSHATVGTGLQALTAGDANGDGQVQNTDDVYLWQPTVGSAGYEGADYNLDGQVQNNDKVNYWITNAGMGTSIPK